MSSGYDTEASAPASAPDLDYGEGEMSEISSEEKGEVYEDQDTEQRESHLFSPNQFQKFFNRVVKVLQLQMKQPPEAPCEAQPSASCQEAFSVSPKQQEILQGVPLPRKPSQLFQGTPIISRSQLFSRMDKEWAILSRAKLTKFYRVPKANMHRFKLPSQQQWQLWVLHWFSLLIAGACLGIQ